MTDAMGLMKVGVVPILLLLPAVAEARYQSQSCGLAYQMEQIELPGDIAVKVDPMTSAATKIAMDWWVGRLSTPERPVTWHIVEDRDECMIYIRHGWDGMVDRTLTAAFTHTPGCPKYDGIAMIFLINPWVVAHEIGHLIGCRHGVGVMRVEYKKWDERRLWIDNDALHFAGLVRGKASEQRTQQCSRVSRKQIIP
ncbi:MAG TPA: hypothetical protein VK641_17100 [Terriglobales bacterium]|nr:hypothetical protein [Terriglobales bacterium]